jgi:hypothetical protein
MFQIDVTQLIGPAIMGIIGWLIRNTFKSFEEKLDGVVTEVHDMRDKQVLDGERIAKLEARWSGFHTS